MTTAVILDTQKDDDTALIFLEALRYSLVSTMPHEAFRVELRDNDKAVNLFTEFQAAAARAIIECNAMNAAECLHITPLDIGPAGADSVMALILVVVGKQQVIDLTVITYTENGVSDEFDTLLQAGVRKARKTLLAERFDVPITTRTGNLFKAVNNGYALASSMVAVDGAPLEKDQQKMHS